MNLFMKRPITVNDVFIAPTATVIGNVTIADYSSVWYNTVINGDLDKVFIGGCSNIQENCVISTESPRAGALKTDVKVGNYVTVGNSSVLHSCEIGDNTKIGRNCTICEGAKVGSNCIIGDGSLVPPEMTIPDGQMWEGNPIHHVGEVDADMQIKLTREAQIHNYMGLKHRAEFLPNGQSYQEYSKLNNLA